MTSHHFTNLTSDLSAKVGKLHEAIPEVSHSDYLIHVYNGMTTPS